jgi:hypothetical protein
MAEGIRIDSQHEAVLIFFEIDCIQIAALVIGIEGKVRLLHCLGLSALEYVIAIVFFEKSI